MQRVEDEIHTFGDESVSASAMKSIPEDRRTCVRAVKCADADAALKAAVDAVRSGEAEILMKGSIDTGSMMSKVLSEESGLRTGRLLTDVFVLEYPRRQTNKLIMITDGGMTLAPDLKTRSN